MPSLARRPPFAPGPSRAGRLLAGLLLAGLALPAATPTPASAAAAAVPKVPAALAVTRPLGAPPAGVAELKFRDLFKQPVGPKGLEPTDKLLGLDGRRVRLVGYVVQQEPPVPGHFMLSPLPVVAGDADDAWADDIPASAIFVALPKGADVVVPALPGLVQLTGVLRVGQREIPGAGRVAPAVLELDREPERVLLRHARSAARSAPKAR